MNDGLVSFRLRKPDENIGKYLMRHGCDKDKADLERINREY